MHILLTVRSFVVLYKDYIFFNVLEASQIFGFHLLPKSRIGQCKCRVIRNGRSKRFLSTFDNYRDDISRLYISCLSADQADHLQHVITCKNCYAHDYLQESLIILLQEYTRDTRTCITS